MQERLVELKGIGQQTTYLIQPDLQRPLTLPRAPLNRQASRRKSFYLSMDDIQAQLEDDEDGELGH